MALLGSVSRNAVTDAFAGTKRAWLHISLFSAVVNILMLTASLYMMQVYDRVLSSRSIATLIGVSLLALAAYGLQGWLDHIRLKMLGRIGASVDAALSPLTLRAAMSAPLRGASPIDSLQAFRDLGAVRSFLASLGPTALIDMPFAPLFLFVCFVLHPWLGWMAIGGMVVIVGLTVITERRSSDPGRMATQSSAEQLAMIESGRRNAEAILALGMTGSFASRFDAVHNRHVDDTLRLTEASGGVGAFAKIFRYVLQSAVLGLGAYLVIRGELSGGAMLAASILTSRALAPVELAVAHMRGFIAARQGYVRLKQILPHFEQRSRSLALPAPCRSLSVEDISIVPPGARRHIVMGVSFDLKAGEALGLIGPSGSGKSSLVRALVGIWPPARGVVRLDGALITQWDPDQLGRSIGYLPQDVELFPGTIAENIARFDPNADTQSILAATQAAGAHDMIVGFTDGYDTLVGEGGTALSGGQRQRIALARALYGNPFLVVLDEPNSSLDATGDAALSAAIHSVRARGGIVIVITHRPSGLAAVDVAGIMADGRLIEIGPRDTVLSRTAQAEMSPPAARPMAAAAPVPTASPEPAAQAHPVAADDAELDEDPFAHLPREVPEDILADIARLDAPAEDDIGGEIEEESADRPAAGADVRIGSMTDDHRTGQAGPQVVPVRQIPAPPIPVPQPLAAAAPFTAPQDAGRKMVGASFGSPIQGSPGLTLQRIALAMRQADRSAALAPAEAEPGQTTPDPRSARS